MSARILLIGIELKRKEVRLSDYFLRYRIEREIVKRNIGRIVASGASEQLLELEVETLSGLDAKEKLERMMKEKFPEIAYSLEFDREE